MKCEKCGATTSGYDLFDFCAECSRNLCGNCMSLGCCGNIPAISGMQDDAEDIERTKRAWERAQQAKAEGK